MSPAPSESTSSLSRALLRLRSKLTLAIWLGALSRQAALLLALCACAALIGRVAFELELREAVLFFSPLAVVPLSAWRGVRARVPSEASAMAWLDLHSGAEGYLLTDFELGDPRWRGRATAQLEALPELPALRLASFLKPTLPALVFAASALLIPLTRAEPGSSTSLFERAIEGLGDKLETLNEVVDLDEALAEELAERIEQLAEGVDAEQPEAMLEAIDSLREQLQVEGQDAATLAQELIDSLGEIGAEHPGGSDFAQDLMVAAIAKMMESGFKEDLMQQLSELTPELAQSLAGNQMQLPEGLKLSPEQMRALSSALRDALQENIGALNLAGLVNLQELKLHKGSGSLAKIIEDFHECDENCEKPGGT